MQFTVRDYLLAKQNKIDLGVNIIGAPADVTELWETDEWRAYAEQLEEDIRAARRRFLFSVFALVVCLIVFGLILRR